MSTHTKPILRVTTKSREVPARIVEESQWECTCGIAFATEEAARLHYGNAHSFAQIIEIRDQKFHLILTSEDFECWRLARSELHGNHRTVTHNEWDGPGWYCSRLKDYGRHSGSVWDGEQKFVKAESVLKKWQDEAAQLASEIARAKNMISKEQAP